MGDVPPQEGYRVGRIKWNLTGDRFQVIAPLFSNENGSKVRSGYLHGSFGRFGALRGAPWVTDGLCATPGG